MKVEINKREIEVDEGIHNLAELLKAEKLNGPGQAVAIAGSVVKRAEWENYELSEGLKITVIKAVCGG